MIEPGSIAETMGKPPAPGHLQRVAEPVGKLAMAAMGAGIGKEKLEKPERFPM